MLNEILQDHKTGQDSIQLGSFVLGGRTTWGTYKQTLRELYKRVRGLRQMITERDLLLLDIEELEEQPKDDSRDSKRTAIKLRQKYGMLEESDRCIADTKREAALFYRVALDCKSKLGEITEERRHELDREDWKWWHLKRVACQGLDDVTRKNLISLPTAERREWLNVIKDQRQLEAIIESSEYGRIEMYTSEKDLDMLNTALLTM